MENNNVKIAGRTWELILLVVLLLVLAWCGLLRAVEAILNWAFLVNLGILPGPWYLVFSGLAWGIGLFAGAVGLFFRQRWAPTQVVAMTLLSFAWYWADRLLLTRSQTSQYNLPFLAGVSVVFLAFEIGVLRLYRQRMFFGGGRL